MVFAAVFTANCFNGLNTNVWTGWVFFAVLIGVVLLWAYTVGRCSIPQYILLTRYQAIYSLISPGWFSTPVFGNDEFLFPSAYFWLCLPLTIFLSLLPRYIYKAYMFGYAPSDIDILRYIRKHHPHIDLVTQGRIPSGLHHMKRPASVVSRRTSRTESVMSIPMELIRPSMDARSASRTDMATGITSVHRGFDFATEENGVAMRRMQSNLSERRTSSRQLASARGGQRHHSRRETLSHVFSIRRGPFKRKPPSPKKTE